ncbi:MAG: TolC family protein [Chitinophagales bacterium]|nr:TolC family protein [Chitinophagales bacterium]
MMQKTLLLTTALFLAFAAFAQQKEVKAYTVKEAVDYALQNNNAVKNARLDVQKAKWRNLEIYSTGLPKIDANFDYTYYFKPPISPALGKAFSGGVLGNVFGLLAYGDGTPANPGNPALQSILNTPQEPVSFILPHNISTGVQVTQLLFDGRYVFGVKASKDLTKTARLSADMSDFEVKYSVMKAYYNAAAAAEGKALLTENLGLIDKLLSDTRKTFQEGLIEELDVNRLELAQATLNSQIALQNQMAEVALANLKFQMGLSLNEEIILKDRLDELKTSVQAELGVTQFDPKNRIEYNMLETGIRLKGFEWRAKQSPYFPSLYAFMNYGWQSQAQASKDVFKKDSWFDQGLVGLTLKIPIFDSGEKMAQVQQTKLDQQKLKNDFENFKNASELQFRAAQSSFASALTDEANSRRANDLSKKIFDRNTIKYKEGVANSFELQQSQQDLVTNQLKFIQSSLNILNTKADLDKALGKK